MANQNPSVPRKVSLLFSQILLLLLLLLLLVVVVVVVVSLLLLLLLLSLTDVGDLSQLMKP
jgi:hypothetical protein